MDTLNKSDEPQTQEATKRSATGKEVLNENIDAEPQTHTPISSLEDLTADLMNTKQSKIPVKIKFTKVEPSSPKETKGDGIKGRIRNVEDTEEDPDTKGPRKLKTKFWHPTPKTEEEAPPKKDKVQTRKQTRRQRAESSRLANEKLPKKNSTEHRNKIDIEIIELSDDDTKKSSPEHHGAQKAQKTVTKNMVQKTPQSIKPKKNPPKHN